GVRVLGVPTVADRVSQTVVAMVLEKAAEPRFHADSYGYRPVRAAWDALSVTRKRCWEFDWVVDLDVQKFFDTVPWDLVTKAVEAVCTTPWVLLYVKRWLAAPLAQADGTLIERKMGTPQGSAVADPGEPVHALRVRCGRSGTTQTVPSSATPTMLSCTA
ncbi:MAG TPA: reverse transcriptase domain-containing protein, partial [Acidimicrobiales bacterium]|nr:reverse transcriptase domain-containing protein [Acidimicrobiales bacterium]